MSIADIIRKKVYEEIIYRLRKHPLIFCKSIVLFFLMTAIPVVIYYFINQSYPLFLESGAGKVAAFLLGSAYYLAIWVFFFTQFIDYYLDNWVITNDRLVSIDQAGLFGRTISELDLYRIQDVRSEVKGIFATTFNYGDVFVQTAGEKEFFMLKSIPDPHQIREKLLDLAEGDRKYHNLSKT